MPLAIVCPSCKCKLRGPDNLAGRQIKCPKCGVTIVVASTNKSMPPESVDQAIPLQAASSGPAAPPAQNIVSQKRPGFFDRLLGGSNEKKLLKAVAWGDAGKVRSLLASGADPNTRGKRGVTPLMQAAMKGHYCIVELLIEAGANPNDRDNKGESALMRAAGELHLPVVGALLEAGAAGERKGLASLDLNVLCALRGGWKGDAPAVAHLTKTHWVTSLGWPHRTKIFKRVWANVPAIRIRKLFCPS